MQQNFFGLSAAAQKMDKDVMAQISPKILAIDEIKEHNQIKMLKAFVSAGVASNHLVGTSGYGYDDAGRAKLEQVFASVCGAESALFRHNFASGTHVLAVALFGILRPGQTLLCASGKPYDTLHGVIGLGTGQNRGSLADFGIKYKEIALKNQRPNLAAIAQNAKDATVLYLQRSRGYSSRNALSLQDIESAAKAAKAVNPQIVVMVDNCYGEFVQKEEPTQHGADLIAGSLIKNPGGGIAPTGGYIAGKKYLVLQCAHRLTAPGVGDEIGCTPGDILRQMYLGLYYAPGVTASALKTAAYASALFSRLGCSTSPHFAKEQNDIITAITTNSQEKLVALCTALQKASPVDSHLTTEPWPMPGYSCDIIMAAGAFTMGSSIELSCDAPMRPPYTAYMQGGLNFAAGRTAVLLAACAAFPKGF